MIPKILILDNDIENRQKLRKILSKNFEVVEIDTGKKVISIIKNSYKEISLIIFNEKLSLVDKYEILYTVHKNILYSKIPIIACIDDAENNEKTINELVLLGVTDFIYKSYSAEDIIKCMQNNIIVYEDSFISTHIQKDHLTGLLNIKGFFEEAERRIKFYGKNYYIMSCFDIDKFKLINDQYGLETGDKILKHVAACIDKCSKQINGICCRVMVDRFALLYPAKYKDLKFIEDMHKEFNENNYIKNNIVVRVGRYFINDMSISISSMFDRAVLAENSIKGKYGKNIAVYNESMMNDLLFEQKITSEMGNALETGQFEVWFQPQYDIDKKVLIGIEALVRWNHPEEGLLLPEKFIFIFEKNGFIYELDKFIWDLACKELRKDIDENNNVIPIAVNVSKIDILEKDFYDTITFMVEKYQIPVKLLQLEITEEAFSKSEECVVSTVEKLVEKGFIVIIDDFGSGYASLNMLKDVPASIIKIDLQYFNSTKKSDRAGSILESVIRMVKWLGMSVIAESVETKEQVDYLRSIGCTYIQGFYYAKTMPIQNYRRWKEEVVQANKTGVAEIKKIFNSSAFWNPYSMDTLIFNSYVGGAIIVEYHNRKIEVLRVNDRFKEEFGNIFKQDISIRELISLYDKILDEKNLKILYDNIDNAIYTKKEVSFELELNNIECIKEAIYLRCTLRVIAKSSDYYMIYGIIYNITNLHVAEEKIRFANQKLEIIINNIDSCVTASVFENNKIRLLFANEYFYNIFGVTKEDCDNKKIDPFDLFHQDDRKRVLEYVKEASMLREKCNFVYRIIKKDNTIKWMQAYISFVKLPDVETWVQLAVAHDITNEKLGKK